MKLYIFPALQLALSLVILSPSLYSQPAKPLYQQKRDSLFAYIKSQKFPMIDYHVHIKGGLTIEAVLEKSKRLGIVCGVAPNCGLNFPITNDSLLYDYFNKMKSAATENIKVIEQPVKQEEKKQETTSDNRFKITTKNSPYTNYKEVDSLLKEEKEITVATEELIVVKNIKLINLDMTVKDTLSGKLAGVNEDNTTLFFVEFWKTPLNSKGYRMTKNRIILYGFSDFSSINLYKVDDAFYLKNAEQVYKLTSGADFMPMERVSDSDLLAKIN